MPDPTETLADWKAKTDAATEGPWEAGMVRVERDADGRQRGACVVRAPRQGLVFISANGPEILVDDAEFIAASRTAMPKLLAAVESVLALHRRGTVEIISNDESLTDRETCLACTGIDEGDAAPVNEVYMWPCPTVRSVTAALGGDE